MSETQQNVEKHAFQTEVKKVLDIVIHSLYTNREIFVRELISNGADALEKIRHEQIVNQNVLDPELPLEIAIELDEENGAFSIVDTGVGMTREEIIENLGTIAHSGSAEYLSALAEAARGDVNLIGQFGVGFYSAFMVAQTVTVQTRSWRPDAQGYEWTSDGADYAIQPVEGLRRGTRITLALKDDARDFAKADEIRRIVRQYSNFAPFPIRIAGEAANTVQAIWTRNKNEIEEKEYTEFYRFISGDFTDPQFKLHFSADAPLQIQSVLFLPSMNLERLGFSRLEPGVDLYCKKVLIQKRPPEILPDWLRFVRGVVDSADLPLNISRESMQDSALVRKLNAVLTGRVLKMLEREAANNPEAYGKFWEQFASFLKEGVISDQHNREKIAPLLRFETSKTEPGKQASLKEYVDRMGAEQKAIYYINGPNRAVIEAGPYLEAFRQRDIEVIYTHEPVDDFVLTNLREFSEKPFLSADSAEIDLPGEAPQAETAEPLATEDMNALCGWAKERLGDSVSEVRSSRRLIHSAAMAVHPETGMTGAMQRVLQATQGDLSAAFRMVTLELNPSHSLVKRLHGLRSENPDLAAEILAQLYDNALIYSGLLVDSRLMVERINRLLEKAAGTAG